MKCNFRVEGAWKWLLIMSGDDISYES